MGRAGQTWRIAFALGFAAAFALGLVTVGFLAVPSRRQELWFEIGKAGVQVLGIAVLGGFVATTFRYLESKREEQRRLDDYRIEILRDLVDVYNRIKAVRRTLRAYGFRSPKHGQSVTPDQSSEFQTQMRSLLDAQLSLERVAREIKAQQRVFGPDGYEIRRLIGRAERYVHDVVKDWECFGIEIIVGAPAVETTLKLEHLQDFLASAKKDGFKQEVSYALARIEELIRSQLLAPSPLRSLVNPR